ncbi:MAG: ChbG/HpnK family deacetylase, partial [Novosphingobium sp.]
MNARLVICADDVGRSAAINEAVLSLAHRGKLTAASVMVNEPFAAVATEDLLAISGFQIGLHVTLTDALAPSELGMPDGALLSTIDRLTFDAFRGRLPPFDAEITRQFEKFQFLFGRLPDFVDAHQHAHLLPGIRKAVLDVTARQSGKIWVRSCEDSFLAIARRGGDRIRAWRSAWLSRGMTRDAAERGLVTNDGFAGLYALQSAGSYS